MINYDFCLTRLLHEALEHPYRTCVTRRTYTRNNIFYKVTGDLLTQDSDFIFICYLFYRTICFPAYMSGEFGRVTFVVLQKVSVD